MTQNYNHYCRLIAICLFVICLSTSESVAQTLKDKIIGQVLTVEKLVIDGKDFSSSLDKLIVSDSLWVEYDHKGKEIAKAEVVSFTNASIKVKWIQADHGAQIGGITIYTYKTKGEKLLFRIFFNKKEHGYIEAIL